MTKVIALFGNRSLRMSDQEARLVEQTLQLDKPPRFLKMRGQNILLAEVTGVYTLDAWEDLRHEAVGDWKCDFGFWHGKRDECGHTEMTVVPEVATMVVGSSMKAWKWEAFKLNSERLKQAEPGEQIGLIKTEAELAEYRSAGTWPEYLPAGEWHTVDPMYARPVAVEVPFRWVKRSVTDKQFDKIHSGLPGVDVLAREGTDVIIAYVKLMDGHWELSRAEDWCSDAESAKLDEFHHLTMFAHGRY